MRAARLMLFTLPLMLSLAAPALAAPPPSQPAPAREARGGRHKATLQGTVNLNLADEAALELLPGVGESKSARIITYRKTHPFKKVDDLTRVKGFGRKTLAKLRPYLTVSGPTTLKEEAGETK